MSVDVDIPGRWVDIYLSSGIKSGTKIFIQNKTTDYMLLVESEKLPEEDDEGLILPPCGIATVMKGSLGCWAFGHGKLFIENAEA